MFPNRLVDYFVVCGLDTEQEMLRPVDTSHLKTVDDVRPENLIFPSVITDRYPYEDYDKVPVSTELPLFCIPGGVRITARCDIPALYTFVLTGADGSRMYVSCLLFQETLQQEHETKLNKLLDELRNLVDSRLKKELLKLAQKEEGDVNSDAGTAEQPPQQQQETAPDTEPATPVASTPPTPTVSSRKKQTLYVTKSFCVISHYPLYRTFKMYLTELYRISLTPQSLPIERYIQNFMTEIPLPPRGKVQVQCSIGEKTFMISRTPANDFPMLDAEAEHVFQVLSVDNLLTVFNCLMNERQILLIASHYSLLGNAAETLTALLYPFQWHHVYIPVLPKSCTDFLCAPVPFLMGAHRSVIDFDELPRDVIVVDLDSDKVHIDPAQRLPRLPEKQKLKLQGTLQKIFEKYRLKPFDGVANDLAFSLAPPPDMVDEGFTGKEQQPFPLKDIRMAFLRFFVSLFMKYRTFMAKNVNWRELADSKQEFAVDRYFHRSKLIREHPEKDRPFLKIFLDTQCFYHFLLDRLTGNNENDVKFFDEQIAAKANRSRFTLHKLSTPFLNDSSTQIKSTVVALTPDVTGFDTAVKKYIYPTFPKLQRDFFGQHREIKSLVSSKELNLSRQDNRSLDSWKTVLHILGNLSNQLVHASKHGKRKSQRAGKHTGTAGAAGASSGASPHAMSIMSDATEDSDLDSLALSYVAKPQYFMGSASSIAISAGAHELDAMTLDSDHNIGAANDDFAMFSRFVFDTKEVCPECHTVMQDADVRIGWSSQAHDYRTTCNWCGYKFIPRFGVSITDAEVAAVQHGDSMSISTSSRASLVSSTALVKAEVRYEYLGPQQLKTTLENLLAKDADDPMLLAKHPTLFWNLLVHFRNLTLPLNLFLPQVSWRDLVIEMEKSLISKMLEQIEEQQRAAEAFHKRTVSQQIAAVAQAALTNVEEVHSPRSPASPLTPSFLLRSNTS